jgi:hypothetical protein
MKRARDALSSRAIQGRGDMLSYLALHLRSHRIGKVLCGADKIPMRINVRAESQTECLF